MSVLDVVKPLFSSKLLPVESETVVGLLPSVCTEPAGGVTVTFASPIGMLVKM